MSQQKTANKYEKQVPHAGQIELVRLNLMKVSEHAQRERKDTWVEYLIANFDIDKMGLPEVNHRQGYYFIMDSQHRVEAVKEYLGECWVDQFIECRVYEGLTEAEEAEKFLSLNDRKGVEVFQKFKVAVNAGRPTETDISRILKEQKLTPSKYDIPSAIRCVGTLITIHKRNGPDTLQRALRLATSAYGDPGLDSNV